ncbi:methyltransferase family protein [Candidatus Margulisiibacteriota bacterium]
MSVNHNNYSRPKLNRYGAKRIFEIIIGLAVQIMIFFMAAGRLDLLRVWYYFGLLFVYLLISGFLIVIHYPEIANIHGKKNEGTKQWDKVILALLFVVSFIMPLVAGLDIGRGWSSIGEWGLVIGGFIFVGAAAITQLAMVENPHFERTVRIQKERRHKVISSGPYSMVRHPGYVGIILLTLSAPLIMGSLLALLPGLLTVALLIVRTALEDKLLCAELKGYAAYARKVSYKLLPGVW